jgi:hypothetical protein
MRRLLIKVNTDTVLITSVFYVFVANAQLNLRGIDGRSRAMRNCCDHHLAFWA